MKRLVSFLLIITILLLSLFTGCIDNDVNYETIKNIEYQDIPDVDPNNISLDIYVPSEENQKYTEQINYQIKNRVPQNIQDHFLTQENIMYPMPVMIWVHGGGWRSGDKTNQLQYKIPYFINEGWIFVSVNYRLSPYDLPEKQEDLDPNRIQYPIHSQDVSAAIAWVHEHIEEYGGDPEKISLIGHSAGAGIVATIGTNESFLEVHGLSLHSLRHVICLDTAAYDIRERCETGSMLYLNAFGTNPSVWDAASPLNNIESEEILPSFFVVVQGSETRIHQNNLFIEKINQTGTNTEFIITTEYNHAEINQMIGHPADTIITPQLSIFLGFTNNTTSL